MRELQVTTSGRLSRTERPDPRLLDETDVLVRPFVVSRCDGDVLPLSSRGTRALQAGLRLGLVDPVVGHICGKPPFRGPFAIGHEAIAKVVSVGSAVTTLSIGDQVVVPWAVSCGDCPNCLRGLTSKCLTSRADTVSRVAPERCPPTASVRPAGLTAA